MTSKVDAFLNESESESSQQESVAAHSAMSADDSTAAATSASEALLDVRALLRESSAVTTARANELTQVDLGLMTVRNTQTHAPSRGQ